MIDKPDFIEAMEEMMQERVVNSEEEGQAAIDEFKAKGWRVAAISNTNLEPGQARITFMPAKNFTDVTGIKGDVTDEIF